MNAVSSGFISRNSDSNAPYNSAASGRHQHAKYGLAMVCTIHLLTETDFASFILYQQLAKA